MQEARTSRQRDDLMFSLYYLPTLAQPALGPNQEQRCWNPTWSAKSIMQRCPGILDGKNTPNTRQDGNTVSRKKRFSTRFDRVHPRIHRASREAKAGKCRPNTLRSSESR